MGRSNTATKGNTKVRVERPKRYDVIMHNDDFTTMEFVVEVLMTIFHKTEDTATLLMLQVHQKGKAVVGTYSYDIAVTKANKAMSMAKEEGFPFRLTVEPTKDDYEFPF